MRRVLCPVENLYVAQRSRAVLSCVLDGPVDRAALSAAFDAVTAEQPQLRTRIVPDGDGDGGGDSGGHALEPLPEAEWPRLLTRTGGEEAYLEEANTPLTVGGPLTRAVLVTDPDCDARRHTLVLSVDHVVTDGHSGITLLNTLWDRYRELVEGTEGTEGTEGAEAARPPVAAFAEPISTLLPPADPADTANHRDQRAGDVARHPVELVPYDVKPTEEEPEEPHRIEVQRLRLDTAPTAGLRARARTEGVSVHALISAALLLAARRRMDGAEPRLLGCTSPVDLRSRLTPPVSAALMIPAVSMNLQTLPVGKETDILDLARQVGDGLREFLDRGDHFREMRIMPSARRYPTLHLGTVIVTNMGAVSGPRLPAGTRVTDVRLVPGREHYFPQLGRSPILACVTTFDGRLAIEFPHHTACYSRLFMRELADEVHATLLALAGS
ncbi:Condensation domain-containing protein [Streptomyces sp. yr375]|uniref:phthiocerol/phthiodiolone dimycocerosyl transferase family protein n=1 Tax=Streptomyces sp. yr375 TaxID=1761906 RepID=UPI0008ABB0B1|nr:protein kinase [Streptomyces sp. yr375]SEQ90716.1 Condensation domain-containing protein [Streptomyces sp. yr375]